MSQSALTITSPQMTPIERAICAVAMVVVMYAVLAAGAEPANRFMFLFDVLGRGTATAIAAMASGLTWPLRLAVGALVESPLDQATDMIFNRPDAFNPKLSAIQIVGMAFFTLLLPTVDPPGWWPPGAIMRNPKRPHCCAKHSST